MAATTTTIRSFSLQSPNHHHHRRHRHLTPLNLKIATHIHTHKTHLSFTLNRPHNRLPSLTRLYSSGGDGGDGVGGGGGGNGGGDGGKDEDGDGDAGEKNKSEALLVLAEAGRSLESIPKDIAASIDAGKIPGSIVKRYLELEKSAVFRWLLQFGGFKERLLADDLFLTKVGIECGVGIFTKSAAELEKRRENFTKELDFVFADVIMAIIADFMLVWLPAPTVSLRAPIAINAGQVAKFFSGCPITHFRLLWLVHPIHSCRELVPLCVTGPSCLPLELVHLLSISLSELLLKVGTGITNGLIKARKAVDKSFAVEAEEDIPILSTSVAYGVYMAVSSNLRYQVLAGVIEQRMLEPLLHQHKLVLSAVCFAVRTGNTFLGSLMWVDYARWVGIQKIRE
ncbi:hypothetical protein OSB04_012869 [Centaurea solstitialis]|uniref:Protein RETICULATA-RELATED 4, chloroplastic-like n=1 Tax=Centaurea solstitialis TaxID=347529 RepID=A0AA38TC53_9ASTR|nr:hypothetical protein OSB04_012869 [Centaurea solstitialis]